jgi:hypothetical protein
MVVISHPEWWLEHVDELVDALSVAATLPDEPDRIAETDVALSHPGWWAEHPDELVEALHEAERQPPRIDLRQALRDAAERPPPERQPPEHEL